MTKVDLIMVRTDTRDVFFLKETLRLAKKSAGWTNPNPLVGCVIVKNGRIIASGYHKKPGQHHAEIEALNKIKSDIQGATLYVNLEPCSHYGKTPPCVNAIIKAGIGRIVCPFIDPNPRVSGKGIEILRKAGIRVDTGLLQDEARQLNEAYFTFYIKRRPFVVLKFAASLDGKIATGSGDSKWITNEHARRYARQLRSNYQAVLVGINTILKDNPFLDVRTRGKKDPIRIILDSRLRIPLNSNVLKDNNVLIATTVYANELRKQELRKRNIPILVFDSEKINLRELMNEAAKREIISIFVEGGSQVLGSFVDEKLGDKVYVFSAPLLIGSKNAISAISGTGAKNISDAMRLLNVSHKSFGDNIMTTGYIC